MISAKEYAKQIKKNTEDRLNKKHDDKPPVTATITPVHVSINTLVETFKANRDIAHTKRKNITLGGFKQYLQLYKPFKHYQE